MRSFSDEGVVGMWRTRRLCGVFYLLFLPGMNMDFPTQVIETTFPVTLHIRREDLSHPVVSGNKFRKLKYNLAEAEVRGATTVLTFGGAHSNHIAATAFAAKERGLSSVGIIRGDELADKVIDSPTLSFATKCGMRLHFISREDYRKKAESAFIQQITRALGPFYLIPEGGTNALAVRGCEEILDERDAFYDYICCPVGTGGTLSGISNSLRPYQQALGFPAVKGEFIKDDIRKFAHSENWRLIQGYEFGGYAKTDDRLIAFINAFFERTRIPLDPVYTGKMVFGVMKELAAGFFPEGAKILMIHTGGLQGIAAMNRRLLETKRPILITDV